MFPNSRRSVLAAAAVAAAGAWPARPRAQVKSPQPILIGCITSLSGPQEVLGRPMLNGAQIAADQINAAGGVLGRPLEIVEADDRADPGRAVLALRDLAKARVNLFCGVVTSPVALALTTQLTPLDAVLITCAAASDKLTHEAFTPNYFRVTDQTYMRNRAQARLMAERYPGVTRWGAIIPDVEYGRSAYAAFRDGLLEFHDAASGGSLVLSEPIVAHFGATDFQQQISTLRDTGAEGMFIAVYGSDAIALYQQFRQSGLLDQIKVLVDSTNEFLVPMELGTMTPENLWLGMTWYFGGYQNLPMGRQLYQEYLKRTGNALPLGFVNAGHSAVYGYAAALRRARSTETASVVEALEGLAFDTAKGPVTFRREDHQAICDVNFIRIKSSSAEPTLDAVDYTRPDIGVAEFIRYDGASLIEPPSPGTALVYRPATPASVPLLTKAIAPSP